MLVVRFEAFYPSFSRFAFNADYQGFLDLLHGISCQAWATGLQGFPLWLIARFPTYSKKAQNAPRRSSICHWFNYLMLHLVPKLDSMQLDNKAFRLFQTHADPWLQLAHREMQPFEVVSLNCWIFASRE